MASGVELGAGMGLPSILTSNCRARVIATDGDDAELYLSEPALDRDVQL